MSEQRDTSNLTKFEADLYRDLCKQGSFNWLYVKPTEVAALNRLVKKGFAKRDDSGEYPVWSPVACNPALP